MSAAEIDDEHMVVRAAAHNVIAEGGKLRRHCLRIAADLMDILTELLRAGLLRRDRLSGDYMLQEDGTLTCYYEICFDEDLPQQAIVSAFRKYSK